MNKVFLFGHITRDPVIFENKSTCMKFNLATNERFKKYGTDEWQEKSHFHNITVWGGKADFLNGKLFKGMPVVIEGRNVDSKYPSKTTGETVYSYAVEAIDVKIIPGWKKSNGDKHDEDDFDI